MQWHGRSLYSWFTFVSPVNITWNEILFSFPNSTKDLELHIILWFGKLFKMMKLWPRFLCLSELSASAVLVGQENKDLANGKNTLVAEQRNGNIVLKWRLQCYLWNNGFVITSPSFLSFLDFSHCLVLAPLFIISYWHQWNFRLQSSTRMA